MEIREKLERNRKITESGCWLWTKCLFSTGYGCIPIAGRNYSTHRAAYEVYVGPIPEGRQICHHCDVKACFNPAHLYAGDAKQNMRDALERGQQPVGDRHWRRQAKHVNRQRGDDAPHRTLCEADVKDILRSFASGETQSDIARRSGVSVQQIHRIVHRQCWQHVAI